MYKMGAITRRILAQFAHDKRTVGLLCVAPILVLWLLSVLLGNSLYVPKIAIVDMPSAYVEAMEEQDVKIKDVSLSKANDLLEANEADAILRLDSKDETLLVKLEGSSNTRMAAVMGVVSEATSDYSKVINEDMMENIQVLKDSPMGAQIDFESDDVMIKDVDQSYLHGDEDWEMFDFYGPIFIGIFVFVFTFLTSGMSLVNEKSRGTMERLRV